MRLLGFGGWREAEGFVSDVASDGDGEGRRVDPGESGGGGGGGAQM